MFKKLLSKLRSMKTIEIYVGPGRKLSAIEIEQMKSLEEKFGQLTNEIAVFHDSWVTLSKNHDFWPES